jgi:hypothetical protein
LSCLEVFRQLLESVVRASKMRAPPRLLTEEAAPRLTSQVGTRLNRAAAQHRRQPLRHLRVLISLCMLIDPVDIFRWLLLKCWASSLFSITTYVRADVQTYNGESRRVLWIPKVEYASY